MKLECFFAAGCFLAVPTSGLAAVIVSQTQFDDPRFTVLNDGRGQSFTPSVLGDGSGSFVGSTTELDSLTFRFSPSGPEFGSAQGRTLRIYDSLPPEAALGAGTGALFASTGTSADAVNRLVTWSFPANSLNINSTYYALLDGDAQLVYSFQDNPYTGGQAYYLQNNGTYVTATPNLDVWFEASFDVIPEPSSLVMGAGLGAVAFFRRRR